MDRIQNTVTNFKFKPVNVRNALNSLNLSVKPKNTFIQAAVFLPVFNVENSPYLLLIKRSDKTKVHKGEIALPGGTKESRDSTPLETALRETQEELGIEPSSVEILGQLNTVTTKTGFLIDSFVGEIRYPCPLTVNHDEVAEIIELPIGVLTDWNYATDTLDSGGPSLHYGPHYIWGATARILREFASVINPTERRIQILGKS